MTENINNTEVIEQTGQSTGTGMKRFVVKGTLRRTLSTVTDDYINYLLSLPELPSRVDIGDTLLVEQQREVDAYNASADKDKRWSRPTNLRAVDIASIMVAIEHVINVPMGDENAASTDNDELYIPEDTQLAIYIDKGADTGIYSFNEDYIRAIIRSYWDNMTSKGVEEVFEILEQTAPLKSLNKDANLIPVNNGIFNYETKELIDFTPDYVFVNKSSLNYDPNAKNVYITMPDGEVWDCDKQLEEMAGDNPEMVNLLIQIMSAVLRPNAPLNRAVMLYNTTGATGKGTYLTILRGLVSERAYLNLNLDKLTKEPFILGGLRNGKTAVFADESDVGGYIDSAADFKSLITGDPILVNKKYKDPINVRWSGSIVMCLNSFPRVRDRSGSFLRRLLFVPFETKFLEKGERKYIKEDYLKRPDVLRYYLKVALESNFGDSYVIPDVCADLLDTFDSFNNPIQTFWNEVKDELKWSVQPKQWLYELYKGWSATNNPTGGIMSREAFWQDLTTVVKSDGDSWTVNNSNKVRINSRMDADEPLITKYSVEKYYNPVHKGSASFEKRRSFERPLSVRCALERNN